MRLFITMTLFAGILLLAGSVSEAQQGGGKGKGGKGGTTESVDDFVAKLMAFSKAKDGQLIKSDLTDRRLHALFDRADTNQDGFVTRAELEALYKREKLEGGGGFGGDGPKGKGGKGGKGGQPGQILPGFLQDALNLNDAQRKKIADLQKEVDAKLDKILTADQRTQLREMSTKGFGPPGGKKGPPPDKKGPPPDEGR